MSIRSRLVRLERTEKETPPCPACRDRRGRIALVSATERPDGQTVREEDLPAP
jgi:hypothetical protein